MTDKMEKQIKTKDTNNKNIVERIKEILNKK